jgi:ParB family chromosome partitioning protein
MTRKALGKGLEALLPETYLLSDEEVTHVDVDRIQPNPFQPRSSLAGGSDPDLEGLTESIRVNGIIEPLIARRVDGEVQLISGERRWRAARAAGLGRVPVIFRNLEDEKLLEVALVENLQRQSLNPIEEASAYETLVERMGLSQAEIARRIGRTRSSVANSLRLLRLPPAVRDDVAAGRLSTGHAKILLGLEKEEDLVRLAGAIKTHEWSVRELENRLREGRPARKARSRARMEPRDPHLDAAEAKLREALCTRVRIVSRRGKGKILIDFHSDEELQRLYDILIHPGGVH